MKKQLSGQASPVLLGLSIFLVILLSGALVGLAAGEYRLAVGQATGGGQILQGEGYTLVGSAGQPEAGRLSGDNFRLNGGVIGEMVPPPQAPQLLPRAFLPIAWRIVPAWLRLDEAEPNNLFSQANPVPWMPALVSGAHDGAAGGGDVFGLSLEAGRDVDARLITGDASGVQLLAYDAAGVEIGRDYAEPFRLSFTTSYAGTYFIYVFSDPEAENLASYTLLLQTGNSLERLDGTSAPVMNAETSHQPPQVEPSR